MLGLFGTLDLARRALQTQQQGLSVTSNNIANASNPAYSRQRVVIQTSPAIPVAAGYEGTGCDVVAIQQIRSALLDRQIQSETSVTGFWSAQQQALQQAQAALGEQLGSGSGLGDRLAALFNSFQNLTTDPSSLAQRQLVLSDAQNLAIQFNQIAHRLDDLRAGLNESLSSDVTAANQLLGDITQLNDQIMKAELAGPGTANDLRDLRQQKLEELSQYVHIDTAEQSNGAVNVAIAGNVLVSDNQLLDTLAFDGTGVRTATGGAPLTLTGGSIAGTLEARDDQLAGMSNDLDTLAAQLISAVNTVHQTGFSLTGSTNAAFFTGADARTIAVNGALLGDPRLLQASSVAGAVGNNEIALQLAQLAGQPQAALGGQTFSEDYGQIVTGLGQALASVNGQVADQSIVAGMLQRQRESVSGVSLDEEVTNLTKFQRAFEASSRVVTTIDELLETVINMKR